VPTKFLIIQTSFLGDVILATAVIEKLYSFYPDGDIDFLVRKGNESVLQNNPKLNEVLVWDKKNNKYGNLFKIIAQVRDKEYDYVINLHRFGSSGLVTFSSGAKFSSGFHNNPFAFSYTHKYKHILGNGMHEVERNQQLISFLTDSTYAKPKIYPRENDYELTSKYKSEKYICIAPGSVWATKRLPLEKWVEICNRYAGKIYIIGSPEENELALEVMALTKNKQIESLCGVLTLLQTAAMIQDAAMNYVNDSAPLHLCSAMNAACTAFFCSTVPEFGFGPLADGALTIQTDLFLDCKPCGVHGFKVCPRGHFKCGHTIDINKLPIL
jgi:ADP-heptose:LPS heptosyltransferase